MHRGRAIADAYRCGHPSQPLQSTPICVTQLMGINGPVAAQAARRLGAKEFIAPLDEEDLAAMDRIPTRFPETSRASGE